MDAVGGMPLIPMAKEPTRRHVAGLVRGFAEDVPRELGALLGFFAAGAVREAIPVGASCHGVGELRALLAEWIDSSEHREVAPREARDLGNGLVLRVVDQLVRPAARAAGAHIRAAWTFVFVGNEASVGRVEDHRGIAEPHAAGERLAEEVG